MIRTSRMSFAFRAVPRPTGNQEICHLLVTLARCHGDTSLVGCSSPLAVWSSRGLSSPGSRGLWFLHVRAHPLPCVDLCIFLVFAGWCRRPGLCVFASRAMVGVAAVPGGIQIRGSRSLVCKAAAAFSLKPVEVLKFAFFLPRVVSDGFGTVRMCVASPWVAQA